MLFVLDGITDGGGLEDAPPPALALSMKTHCLGTSSVICFVSQRIGPSIVEDERVLSSIDYSAHGSDAVDPLQCMVDGEKLVMV